MQAEQSAIFKWFLVKFEAKLYSQETKGEKETNVQ